MIYSNSISRFEGCTESVVGSVKWVASIPYSSSSFSLEISYEFSC